MEDLIRTLNNLKTQRELINKDIENGENIKKQINIIKLNKN